jgi:hypothetical protein
MRWQENVEQTLTGKKNTSVASLSQLVQHEKKKSYPTRSQKDRECLICTLKSTINHLLLKLGHRKISLPSFHRFAYLILNSINQ